MKFPAFFPVTREPPSRDGFARDSLLQQGVTCEPERVRRRQGTTPLRGKPTFAARLAGLGRHRSSCGLLMIGFRLSLADNAESELGVESWLQPSIIIYLALT